MKKAASPSTEDTAKSVSLFVQSEHLVLSGQWDWEMNSDAVYCSDVMLTLPPQFLGTKGIIHPDDVAHVKKALSLIREKESLQLQFRMITTYGEVKTITGKNISIAEEDSSFPEPEKMAWEEAATTIGRRKENEEFRLKKEITDTTERLHSLGTWHINAITNECFYSDNVYRIHGLSPQSLNAHPDTFHPFIHPDDAAAVTHAFDKAYAEQLPLHLEYRIIKQSGDIQHVQQITQWSFNTKGESIFSGVLQDLTEQKELEDRIEKAEGTLQFYRQTLQFGEQDTGAGNWTVHLLTRKISYSDNFYRLYGLKPQVTFHPNQFLNLIHPDDRSAVEEANNLIFTQHQAPELEYRIIRPDGKTRYLRQKGKLVAMPNAELVMIVHVQDLTVQKMLEKKVQQWQHEQAVEKITRQWIEETAGISTIIWELPEGKMTWSESFYKLIGYKPEAIEATQAVLLKNILPADRERIADELKVLLETRAEKEMQFRMITRGIMRHIKALFKPLTENGKEMMLGLLQDISREAGVQQQLSEQMQLATQLSDTIHDAIIVTDITNTIISWNRPCEEKTGIQKGEALQKNFFDVFPHLKELPFISHLQAALSGETIEIQEARGIYLKGYQNFYLSPVINGEQVVGILHVVQDFNREHELQRRLNERLNFIESLVEASVDRIIVLDRNMNYMYWNKRAEEYYGIAKEKILGKNILEVFPSFRNEPSYQEFRSALKGETVHLPAATDNQEAYFETYLIPVKNEKEEVTAVLWIVHDLSKEYALAQEQRRASRIFDTIRELYVELDKEGTIKYVNRHAEELWQKNKEELIGRNIWEVFPQAKDSGGYQIIQRALEEKTAVQGEYFSKVLHKWTYMSAVPSAEGIVVLFYDISDIKIAQQQIEENSRMIRATEEVAQTGSYEADLATGTYRFTDGIYKLFGEEPQSFPPSLEFIDSRTHPDDVPVVKQVLEQAVTDKQPYYYTCRITKEGEQRLLEVHGKVVCDENGNVVQLLGLLQDITERKKAEETLQQMLNGSISAITILQSVRNEQGTITDFVFKGANKAAEAINRMPVEEIVGRRLLELFPGVKDVFFDLYVQVVETGAPMRVQKHYAYEHFDNWFDVSAVKNGDGFIMTFHDITERKKAEAELQKNLAILQHTEELAQIGSWEYEIATGNFNWSEGMYRLFGLPKGTRVTPQTYLDFAEEEDRTVARRILKNLEKKHQSFEETLRIKTNDAVRLLKIKGSVVQNEKGEPQKIVGVDLDITGIKEAEEKLEKSQRRLQQTAEASPDAITIYDLTNKQPFYLNNCLAQWLGTTSEELVSMGINGRLELIHPEDRLKLFQFNETVTAAPDGDVRTLE
ncbi:MAG: PAS domain-containing protein, partial [Flavisolibacter sp.]|nr:PAS domain-containing protein [Flavisolibacter sp.]